MNFSLKEVLCACFFLELEPRAGFGPATATLPIKIPNGFFKTSLDKDGASNCSGFNNSLPPMYTVTFTMQLFNVSIVTGDCLSNVRSAFSEPLRSGAVDGRASLSGSAVDWGRFEQWLVDKGFTWSYRKNVLIYAKRYARHLLSGSLREVDDEHALKGLSNLSKFLGCYSMFKELKENAGLKWSTETGEEAFMQIYGGQEVEGILEWVAEVKEKFEREISFPVGFMMLTGLRTQEAIDVLNLIGKFGLGAYPLNSDWRLMEHFKVKGNDGKPLFLRRTKKCFVSALTERLAHELEDWHENTTYTKLRKRLERRGIDVRFYDARKWFNTTLREGGIEQEMCDLLCGRLPRNVFLRSYWRPELGAYFEKVRRILRPYEEKLLA